jgi:hypothetical protein
MSVVQFSDSEFQFPSGLIIRVDLGYGRSTESLEGIINKSAKESYYMYCGNDTVFVIDLVSKSKGIVKFSIYNETAFVNRENKLFKPIVAISLTHESCKEALCEFKRQLDLYE